MEIEKFELQHHAHHVHNVANEYLSSSLGKDYHSIVYNILFYLVCFSTVKLLLLFKSPNFYKKIIHKIFSIKITLFKHSLSLYFVILIWILLLISVFIVAKMQSYIYNKPPLQEESLSVREERLKNKWTVESELWMLTILIIEWM